MDSVLWAFESLNATAVLDILLVALILFGFSFLIRGTQAVTLLRGMILFLGVTVVVTNLLNLLALRWLLQNILTVLAVAIPVIFQPELRRGLERLGRGSLFSNRLPAEATRARIIEDVCTAAERLSERRHGALIVLERNSPLGEFVRTGVLMNSDVSPQVLLTIFWPKTELHDGAVIVDNSGRIASAASVLPLSSSRSISGPKLGTRHRAALGMSEISDAVCVVVSEETGRISIANAGRLIQRLDSARLRTVLNAFYGAEQTRNVPLFARARDLFGAISNSAREGLNGFTRDGRVRAMGGRNGGLPSRVSPRNHPADERVSGAGDVSAASRTEGQNDAGGADNP